MTKKLINWIKVQRAGPFSLNANQPTSNVFIADFIELKNFDFCRTVVNINNNIFQMATECIETDSNENDKDFPSKGRNNDDECNENKQT